MVLWRMAWNSKPVFQMPSWSLGNSAKKGGVNGRKWLHSSFRMSWMKRGVIGLADFYTGSLFELLGVCVGLDGAAQEAGGQVIVGDAVKLTWRFVKP